MYPKAGLQLTAILLLLISIAACPAKRNMSETPEPAAASPGLVAVGWTTGTVVQREGEMLQSERGVLLQGREGSWAESTPAYDSPLWALTTAATFDKGILLTGFDSFDEKPLAFVFDGRKSTPVTCSGCGDALFSDCDAGPDNVVRCTGVTGDVRPVIARLQAGPSEADTDKETVYELVCREPGSGGELVVLNDIECYAPDRALAVGAVGVMVNGSLSLTRGVIYKLEGGEWSNISPVGVSERWSLTAASIGSDGTGYMVGEAASEGQGLMLAWDGRSPVRIDLPRYADSWWLSDIQCTGQDRCLVVGAAQPGEGLLLLWRKEDVLSLSVARPAEFHSFERVLPLPAGDFAVCGAGMGPQANGFVLTQSAGLQRLAEFPELGALGGYGILDITTLP